MNKKPSFELMSPVGSFECLSAAINGGANSIYFGVSGLNMRSGSGKSFSLDDISKVSKICSENKIKSYLTLNTVIYEEDFEFMKTICDSAKKNNISAIIAMDMAVMLYCKSINMKIHSSTQLNISNIEAVKFYAQFTDAIVLARELTLKQITSICNVIKKDKITGPSGDLLLVEIFVHGALCMSISGKCYLSLGVFNRSANRGECLQPCRRKYKIYDEETENELSIENKYVMSPKDLCTITFLDKLLDAGVSILKIEGRARPADYVYTVTKAYKTAIKLYETNTFSISKAKILEKDLETVFNRGFWRGGYYLGKKLGEWAGVYGSKATEKKIQIGRIVNYFSRTQVAECVIQSEEISVGDKILITGPTTGAHYQTIESIHLEKNSITTALKGSDVTIPVAIKVRKNDKLFVIKKNE